jgi:hypothetical protein
MWRKTPKIHHFVAMLPLEQVPQETAEYSKSTAEVHWDDISDFLT